MQRAKQETYDMDGTTKLENSWQTERLCQTRGKTNSAYSTLQENKTSNPHKANERITRIWKGWTNKEWNREKSVRKKRKGYWPWDIKSLKCDHKKAQLYQMTHHHIRRSKDKEENLSIRLNLQR